MTTKEQQTAGASYILSFYTEVAGLTHNYAIYLNLLHDIEHKHGQNFNNDNIDDVKKVELEQTIQTLRYSINKVKIQYISICRAISKKPDEALLKNYIKIQESYIINRDILTEYVTILNAELMAEIIQDLLSTSNKMVNAVYNNNE